MLSDRIRAGTEAAPWVVDEVRKLEATIAAFEAENRRLREAIEEWARAFGLAHPTWKAQPVNLKLFIIAAEGRGDKT